MTRSLTIHFDPAQAEQFLLIHRVQNFGEDVFRELRVTQWGEIDIHEVDTATDCLVVRRIANSKVRRLKAWIEREMARQHLKGLVEIG
ncbi:hypothetical protein [Mesorhizobium sp. CN2-181]|uniref:hypothetical protein n=1 Tax=Mesorhizobium yinganensis TaxID=3157707 RepID=UPI0032B719B6